jgi:multidrug efflux pump subunit AcrA (membrane-fusion protein)
MNAASKTAIHTDPKPHVVRRAAILALVLLIVALIVGATGILTRVHARSELRTRTNRLAVPDVSLVTPQSGQPVQEIVLPGTVQAFHDAPIYARTSGYVTSWTHDIGTRVHKGDLLAVIATPELDRQVAQARAAVETAKANLRLANITANRYESLRGTRAVSKQSIDTASQTNSAQYASLQVAQQNLNQMLALQSFERVYAPFTGVVTARNTDIGQLVAAGTTGGTGAGSMFGTSSPTVNGSTPQELFRVSDVRTVRIFVQVPGEDVPEAQPGVVTEIQVPGYPGRVFTGHVVRTSHALDLNTRALTVEVDIDNRDGALLPGAYAEVHLKLPVKHPGVIVPVDALMFRSEGLRVVTVDSNHHAHLVPITVGRDWGTKIEVLTGLQPGEPVILTPPDSIVDGEFVHVVRGEGTQFTGGVKA